MKKIINGKAYNTETATKLASIQQAGRRRDERGAIIWSPEPTIEGAATSTLYQTRGGAYFLVRDIMEGVEADPDLAGNPIISSGLYPLTREVALAWAEMHFYTAERIEEIFGEIEEAGESEGAMLLRLPDALKRRVQVAAEREGQSLNAWVMRCLERCAEAVG